MNVRMCGLGAVLLLLGVAGYGGVKWAEARADATARWPSVPGQIVTSEVSTALVKTGPVRRVSPVAKIRYAYTVRGQRYECDGLRVIPMLHSRPEGTPEELVARYPAGKNVAVYYDPADPRDALLTPVPAEDARSLIRSLTFLGACVGFVGLLLVVIGGAHLRRERHPPRTVPRESDGHRPETPPVAAAPAVRLRPAHRLLRIAATTLGLFFLLAGTLFLVAAATTTTTADAATQIVGVVIFAGVTLFGGFLVYVGVRKPRGKTFAV
jgi:hypothetical protein